MNKKGIYYIILNFFLDCFFLKDVKKHKPKFTAINPPKNPKTQKEKTDKPITPISPKSPKGSRKEFRTQYHKTIPNNTNKSKELILCFWVEPGHPKLLKNF